jgi:hypothetical protein
MPRNGRFVSEYPGRTRYTHLAEIEYLPCPHTEGRRAVPVMIAAAVRQIMAEKSL